ncbi:MAG: flagellar biosynthetic protein FliQ [Candidatus Melainabacteria bacterium]
MEVLLLEHVGHGLGLMLTLSLPAVLLAATIGLVVGIIQAVTQVQEQTISAAPKILLVFMLVIFGGGLMVNMLSDYLRESFHIAFTTIPQMEQMVMPPLAGDEERSRIRSFFKRQVGSTRADFDEAARMRDGFKLSDQAMDANGKRVIPNGGRPAAGGLGIAEQMRLRQDQNNAGR